MVKMSRAAWLFAGAAFLAWPAAHPSSFLAHAASALTGADTDADGTLDLNEVKAAAALEFNKLDTDNDGTIDAKEAGDHVSQGNFAAADTDKDGTLSKDEYVSLSEPLFKAANPDGDATVDSNELHSENGSALSHLIQ
jgi:Ca2+-binding EF-hand superfamily protein